MGLKKGNVSWHEIGMETLRKKVVIDVIRDHHGVIMLADKNVHTSKFNHIHLICKKV